MLGDTVRRLREDAEHTQTELAIRAGISQGYLSQVETGDVTRISLINAQKLAQALDVNIYSFVDNGERNPILPELLHELGDMPQDTQLRLLQFLGGVGLWLNRA